MPAVVPRTEIRDFFFKEGLIRLDETPCNAFDFSVEIIPARWTEFAQHAGIDPGMNPMTVLENLHLVKDARATHSGAWLLTDDISRISLNAGVTCAVFRGSAKTHILDRKEFHGNLYAIYQEVMAYFQAKHELRSHSQRPGARRAAGLARKHPAEALVNAIAHRDYRSTANVQVYLLPGPGGNRYAMGLATPVCGKKTWAAGASPAIPCCSLCFTG